MYVISSLIYVKFYEQLCSLFHCVKSLIVNYTFLYTNRMTNDKIMYRNRDSLGKYIDTSELKDHMFTYVEIYVEVDIEKELLEVVRLTLDNWWHVQPMVYDQ